jgi:hypothetical protein
MIVFANSTVEDGVGAIGGGYDLEMAHELLVKYLTMGCVAFVAGVAV